MKIQTFLFTLIIFLCNSLLAQNHFFEDFNSTNLPAGWTTTAISGSQTWSVGLDGSVNDAGNNNLNGTGMAFFDDDGLGGGNLNNTSSLTSPVFDNSQDTVSILEFTYNYRTFSNANDSFYVEVFDGLNWNTVFSRTNNDCGNYLGCAMPYPKALLNISAYQNPQCQVRFTYHDGNNWAYYVALDDVSVYEQDSIDLAITQLNAISDDVCSNALKFEVSLKNEGYADIQSFVLAHRVDSGNIYYDTINTAFRNDTINTFLINSPFVIPDSNFYTTDAWVIKTSDVNLSNDSLSLVSFETRNTIYYPNLDNVLNNIARINIPLIPSDASDGWYKTINDYATFMGFDSASNEGYISFYPRLTPVWTPRPFSIISPCINLKQVNSPYLAFRYFRRSDWNDPMGPTYIEIKSGSTWFTVDSLIARINGGIKEIDLSSFKGQEVSIRFRHIPKVSTLIDRYNSIWGMRIIDIPQYDIQLTEESISGCYFDTTATYTVKVKNIGTDTIKSNSAWLFIKDVQSRIDSQIIANTIPPKDSVIISLNTITNRSQSVLRAWLYHPNDTVAENDTITSNEFNYSIENFETITPNHTIRQAITSTLITSTSGSDSWQVVNDSLVNITSGPSFDHTLGAGNSGNYIYLNSTGTFDARLVLDCINLGGTNSPSVSFWYHKYGNQMGDLYIDAFDGFSWILGLDTIVGQTQNASNAPWKYRKVSLNDNRLKGNSKKLRFRAVGSGTNSRMAIDDIKFEDIELQDLGLVEYVNPKPRQCFASTEPLIVTLRNDGFLPLDFNQDSVFISSTVIGPNFQTLIDTIFDNTLNGGSNLLPGDSITINIGQLNLQALGRYLISTNIVMSSDDNDQNDFVTEILDVLNPVGGTIELISHDTSINKVCPGDSIELQSENSIGEIQWQEFIGSTWQDLVGETDTTISLIANKNSLLRLITCSSSVSTVFDVNSILRQFDFNFLGDSLTVNCGASPNFSVYNSNIGIEEYNWYANQNAINPIYTGDTFKLNGTNVSPTRAFLDTVFVEAEEAYIESKLGPQNPNLLGSFGYFLGNYPIYFSFFNSNIINTIDVYPQSNGPLQLIIKDSLGSNIYFDSTYQLVGGVKNTVFLDQFLDSGAYSIYAPDFSFVNGLLRNNSNSISNSFFNVDSSVVIYPQSNQNYYYYYNWNLGSECISERTPVYLYADCLVGIDDGNSNTKITFEMYPNPTDDGIVSIKTNYRDEFSLNIFDLKGKAVFNELNLSGNRTNLDLRELANGVYLVQVLYNNRIENLKIIIQ